MKLLRLLSNNKTILNGHILVKIRAVEEARVLGRIGYNKPRIQYNAPV